MGADQGQSGGSVPPCELSTDAVFAGDPMLIIRGQSAEGQGRPVDANGRHAPCKLFLPQKVYKKGAGLCPLKYILRCHFVLLIVSSVKTFGAAQSNCSAHFAALRLCAMHK